MAAADYRLATDTTLGTIFTALGASGVLAKDATLEEVADALGENGLLHSDLGHIHTDLGTTIHGDLTGADGINDSLQDIHGDLTGTGGINDTLSALAKDATLQAVASILASVKSVNSKYGIVVLDSGDILIAKNTTGSKTVKQVLTELQTAVAATPLTFTVSQIEQTGKYKLIVTQGTPS